MSINPQDGWSKSDWIKALLLQEKSFSVDYKQGITLEVEFQHNGWNLAKKATTLDIFRLNKDLMGTITSDSPLLNPVIKSVTRYIKDDDRGDKAIRALEKIISIWCGSPDNIIKINK